MTWAYLMRVLSTLNKERKSILMRRVASILLVFAIFLTLAPMSVFADEEMNATEYLDDVYNMSSEEYAEWKQNYIASQQISLMSDDEISLYASNSGYIRNDYIEAYIRDDGYYTIGTVAGDPNSATDNNKKLLFGHPEGSTSETLIRIDGADYFFSSSNSTFSSDGTKCVSSKVIDGVTVTQTISLVYNSETSRTDTVEIKYDLKNNSTVAKEIGGRIMLDTMLGSNDGAPFKIPGKGDITTECEYVGDQIPQYWQSFDNLTNTTIIATGTFYKTLSQRPDKVQFAYWADIRGAAWNYIVDPYDTVTRDSAVAVYYNPVTVAGGATRSFSTYYGLSNLTEQETVGEVSYRLSGTKSEFQLNDEGTAYIGNPFTLTMYIQNTTSESKEVEVTLNIPSELTLNDVNDSLDTYLTVGSNEVVSVKWGLWAQPQYTSRTVEYSVSIVVDGEETTETYSLLLPAVVACDVNGHSYGDWHTISEPTCTTSGLEYHACQRTGCGYEETKILEPLGHELSEEWTVNTEPTCTTEGSKSRHCSRCGGKADVTAIEMTGHSFGEWIIEKEPSILEDGLKTRECVICGEKEEETIDKDGTETEIPEGVPAITVSSPIVRVGDTVSIDVAVVNNPGIASMNLKLHYDSEYITLTGVEDAGILGETVHSDNLTLNPYILTWANDTVNENFASNGTIVTLTFTVSEDAPLGNYPIWVSYDNEEHDIFDINLNVVDFYTVAGSITVSDYILGDVNDDRFINTLDRAILSRYLAKWIGYDTINTRAADVNKDGHVNSLDRAILTRHLSGWVGYETLPYRG